MKLILQLKRDTWDESEHPRGEDGRFIRAGDRVRLRGGQRGRVVGVVAGGRVAIERDDGGRELRPASEVSQDTAEPATAATSQRSREEALAELNKLSVRNGNISLHALGVRKATARDVGFDARAVHLAIRDDLPAATSVNLKDAKIVTTQGWASKATVEHYLRTNPSSEIVAVRYRGKLIIMDGNHRLAAAILRGLDSVPMHVVDGDKLSS